MWLCGKTHWSRWHLFPHFTDRELAHMIYLDNVACVEMTTFQFNTEVFRHATDFYACFSVTAESRVSLGSSRPFNLGFRVNTYSTDWGWPSLRWQVQSNLQCKAELSIQATDTWKISASCCLPLRFYVCLLGSNSLLIKNDNRSLEFWWSKLCCENENKGTSQDMETKTREQINREKILNLVRRWNYTSI